MDIASLFYVILGVMIGAGAAFWWLQRLLHHARAEIGQLQHALSELQIREGRLDAQLQATQATTDHLRQVLATSKEDLTQWQGRFEESREAHQRSDRQLEKLGAQNQHLQERLDAARALHAKAEDALADMRTQYDELKTRYTRLVTELDEREASHRRELASFEKQKAGLIEQFKVLSSEILEAKSKTMQETSKSTLSSLMSPFQKSLEDFKKEVQTIHNRETEQQGKLRQELQQLKELNRQITEEAHGLATALHGQKKMQGNWGELILENVLDRSGLIKDKDYKREVSFNTDNGRQRPDVIVYLPQDRHLIIDAKVSLNAYTRYVNADDEAERQLALREHVQALAAHIKELADKRYDQIEAVNSPAVTFMFIPIESAFVEALKADETLFQHAIEDNVLVATPTTLLTSLNIVRQLWQFEEQNKHTAQLVRAADGVFNKLRTFLQSFERLKKGLDAAVDAYHSAEGQLVSGRGNLVKRVNEFKQLAPSIQEQLPEYFTEKASLEIAYGHATDDADAEETQAIENEGKPHA